LKKLEEIKVALGWKERVIEIGILIWLFKR